MSAVPTSSAARLSVFHAACWVMGLVAFVQLVLVGAALAVRDQGSPEPRIVERVVTEYVAVPAPTVPVEEKVSSLEKTFTSPGTEPPPWENAVIQIQSNPSTEFARPKIADPVVERLVEEAQAARVADDLGVAIVKLEEARKLESKNPNVLYELGEVAELIGNFGRALDYYQQVFALGTTGAGSLYVRAAEKLSNGFKAEEQLENKISLGRILEFHDKRVTDGEKIVLTIPILAVAGQIKNPEDIVPKVILYDKVGDELVKALETNPPQFKWVSEPVDYQTGEEKLRVTYFIPAVTVADEHLFGKRTYFGHVVELYHHGELLDQKAWPRTLAAKVNAPESDPLFLLEEYLPRDFNPDNPLLPRLGE